jgi:hypothetical protein
MDLFLKPCFEYVLFYRRAEADRRAAQERMDELRRREEEAKRRQR